MRSAKTLQGVSALIAATFLAGAAFAANDETSSDDGQVAETATAVEEAAEAVEETAAEAVEATEEAATEAAEATEEAATEATEEVATEAADTGEEAAAETGEAAVEAPAAADATLADLGELPVIGIPEQDGLGFQPAATELAQDLQWMEGFLLIIITAICIFVVALLAICIFVFNSKRNPNPAKFTHNTVLEICWTLIPILVLIAIAAPSLALLFKQQRIPEGDIVIKATGAQWYWTHEYVDEGFGFDSYMIGHPATLGDDDGDKTFRLTEPVKAALADHGYSEKEFLLATDTAVVIPTGKKIVVQVTGADVIHAWTIPAFGVKQDAVPGRIAELWFEVDEGMEGVYFGQCSELCGKDHTYMPITVKAVTQEQYEEWLESAKAVYAGITPDSRVASR